MEGGCNKIYHTNCKATEVESITKGELSHLMWLQGGESLTEEKHIEDDAYKTPVSTTRQ
jgi:hypothetical protein